MTVGIGVGAQRVCAVGVIAGQIEWAVQLEREPGESLASELEEMLSRAIIPRWPRASVAAAIGAFASQTKLLRELPIVEQVEAMGSVVREGASRFFMRKEESLITSSVLPAESGSAWASAYDESVISQVRHACRALRLSLRLVAPTALALTRATSDGRLEWRDADISLRVECIDGALRHVGRTMATCDPAESPQPVEALAKLGEDAWLFADAYGVTQLSRHEPLALQFDSGKLGVSAYPRASRIAHSAVVLSCAAAVIAPAISNSLAQRSAERHLRQVATRARDVLTNERELERITSALADAESFGRRRHPLTIVLGSLSRALPDQSVLLTLHIDSVGGTAVLLTNSTADAVRAFNNVTDLRAPEIVGPVTKEVSAGRELERATLRFRLADVRSAQ